MDSLKIKEVIDDVFVAFRESSSQKYRALLFQKEQYLEMGKRMLPGRNIDPAELDKIYEETSNRDLLKFKQAVEKGIANGIVWDSVDYVGMVWHSEEIHIMGVEYPRGNLVNVHVRISYNERPFTLIGLQLWWFEDEYKIQGYEFRGLYEVDLDVFVPADDLYLDELDRDH